MLDEMQSVLTLTQEECAQTKEQQPMNSIPFVITYNPHAKFIAEVAKRYWKFLQSKERLVLIFNELLLVACRRPKSLRDRHVSTKFRNRTTDNTLIPKGCRACQRPKCSWCNKINERHKHSKAPVIIRVSPYFILWTANRLG